MVGPCFDWYEHTAETEVMLWPKIKKLTSLFGLHFMVLYEIPYFRLSSLLFRKWLIVCIYTVNEQLGRKLTCKYHALDILAAIPSRNSILFPWARTDFWPPLRSRKWSGRRRLATRSPVQYPEKFEGDIFSYLPRGKSTYFIDRTRGCVDII